MDFKNLQDILKSLKGVRYYLKEAEYEDDSSSEIKHLLGHITEEVGLIAKAIEPELYGKVWDILCLYAGASIADLDRERFVYAMSLRTERGGYEVHEYRFCGGLGFGGKVWRYDGKFYITCYPEDETPDMRRIVLRTNEALKDLTPV